MDRNLVVKNSFEHFHHTGYSEQFSPGVGAILLDGVVCTGKEQSLFDCETRGWNIHNCHHGDDVGVKCSGEL